MPREIDCFACGGDGIETCDNPDHGFIQGMGGELDRLGCPCCGHDPDYKIQGSKCWTCKGTGKITAYTQEELEKAVQEEREAIRQSISDIVYHISAMGCGLEDWCITDKYEAMSYGWEQALDRVDEAIIERGE